MPVSGEQQFFFALFLAPANTVDTTGITPAFTDPSFQSVEAYNTNNAVGPGRLARYQNVATSYPPGSTVDFLAVTMQLKSATDWELIGGR
jgi:hypothetical protein